MRTACLICGGVCSRTPVLPRLLPGDATSACGRGGWPNLKPSGTSGASDTTSVTEGPRRHCRTCRRLLGGRTGPDPRDSVRHDQLDLIAPEILAGLLGRFRVHENIAGAMRERAAPPNLPAEWRRPMGSSSAPVSSTRPLSPDPRLTGQRELPRPLGDADLHLAVQPRAVGEHPDGVAVPASVQRWVGPAVLERGVRPPGSSRRS